MEIRFITILQFTLSLTDCVKESVPFDCEQRAVKKIVDSTSKI